MKNKKRYMPGQKIKMMYESANSNDKDFERRKGKPSFFTVVKQYPHIVHLTYCIADGVDMSVSMTPWEIEHRRY